MLVNCGDGIVQAGEQCDEGSANRATLSGDSGCSTTCRILACGDGIIQGEEQCDDANSINTDDCSNDCRLPECGDGITQGEEQCDDANSINTDNCTNDCRQAVCGDGIVHSGMIRSTIASATPVSSRTPANLPTEFMTWAPRWHSRLASRSAVADSFARLIS